MQAYLIKIEKINDFRLDELRASAKEIKHELESRTG